MLITIKKRTETQETIDAKLPYYFKSEADVDVGEMTSYGKISEHTCVEITVRSGLSHREYQVVIHVGPPQRFSDYFKPEYKGTEAEFLTAKSDLIEALNGA